MCSESLTVCSEIAIVPDSEFTKPILMVSPDVSTHDEAVLAAVVLFLSAASFSATVLPHPQPLVDSTAATAHSAAATLIRCNVAIRPLPRA